ncbi:MAG: hypothetical protein ACK5JJ_16295 [Cyanobacteriota bacterium]|jgi:hypothetical protein
MTPSRGGWLQGWLQAVLVLLALVSGLVLSPPPASAGPVNWQEVAPTAEGRQWWDTGSLRYSRDGRLSVLSRFQPTPAEPASEPPAATATENSNSRSGPGNPPSSPGTLYVMQLDCDEHLYRDTSVNGLPRLRAEWQPTGNDDLTAEVLAEACAAATSLPPVRR